MDGTFIDWLPDGPFRSPAWRWLRASWRHKTGGRPRPGVDDQWVDVARRFLARRDKRAVRPDRVDTAVLGAHALSCAADPHRRWRLEALLLTSEPLEVSRPSLPPSTLTSLRPTTPCSSPAATGPRPVTGYRSRRSAAGPGTSSAGRSPSASGSTPRSRAAPSCSTW